jgi:hypothetical protein
MSHDSSQGGGDDEAQVLASVAATLHDQDVYEDEVLRTATHSLVPSLGDGSSGFPSLKDLAPGTTPLDVMYKVLTQVRREQKHATDDDKSRHILYLQEQMILSLLTENGVSDLPIRRDEVRQEQDRSHAYDSEKKKPASITTVDTPRRPRVPIMQRKQAPVAATKEKEEETTKRKEELRQLRRERQKLREERRRQLLQLDDDDDDDDDDVSFSSNKEDCAADPENNIKAEEMAADDSENSVKTEEMAADPENNVKAEEMAADDLADTENNIKTEEMAADDSENSVKTEEMAADTENNIKTEELAADDSENNIKAEEMADDDSENSVKTEEMAADHPEKEVTCALCNERLFIEDPSQMDAQLSQHMDECQHRRRSSRRTTAVREAPAVDVENRKPAPAPAARKRKREPLVRPRASDSKDDLEEWVYLDRVDEWLEQGLSKMKVMKERDTEDVQPGTQTYPGGLYIPAWINDHLFGYQRDSLQWMWDLHQQEVGGIIGDEMGLVSEEFIFCDVC